MANSGLISHRVSIKLHHYNTDGCHKILGLQETWLKHRQGVRQEAECKIQYLSYFFFSVSISVLLYFNFALYWNTAEK